MADVGVNTLPTDASPVLADTVMVVKDVDGELVRVSFSTIQNLIGGGSISPYTSNPASLGTASPGSSNNYSRGDHVHPMPTAANVGAIAAPSSPATGAFLVWSGSAWVAQTLSTWQGGSYGWQSTNW